MLQMIENHAKLHHMFEKGDKLVAGVSGGADSMAMLHVLHRLAKRQGLGLVAFHLNHNLRGDESDGDERMIREYCSTNFIEVHIVSEDVSGFAEREKIGLEEAGRILRRKHLHELAAKQDNVKLVLAHHRDDQAETVLHNLMRGASMKGLGGMQPVSGIICRPFLVVSKKEMLDYCRIYDIPYRNDSSNADNSYTRNKIRNTLIPIMEKEFNPQLVSRLADMADLFRDEDGYLERKARALIGQALLQKQDDRLILDASRLTAADKVERFRALRLLVEELSGSLRDIYKVHIHMLSDLLENGTGRQVHLPGGMTAERSYNTLEIRKRDADSGHEGLVEQDLYIPGSEAESYQFKRIKVASGTVLDYRIFDLEQKADIPKNKYTKWFDYDKIVGNLTVRARKNGDFLRINAAMDRKKIKDVFIDEKVPRQLRDHIPVIADQEEVLWIVGYRMSDKYKITGTTARVLEVVVGKEEQNVGESKSSDF